MSPTVEVEAAGERASATFDLPGDTRPIAGRTGATFTVPPGAVDVTPATFKSALANTPSGTPLLMRGGIYPTGVTISKPRTLLPYPGHEGAVVVDGGNTASWWSVKAPTNLMGIEFRNFNAGSVTGWLDYGLMFPSGGGDSLVEECLFRGFKGSAWRDPRPAINFFAQTGGLTARTSTFEAAGQGHIYVARCESLLLERLLMREANQDGQQMEPVTAAIKVSPKTGHLARKVVIRDLIIDGVKNAAGVWLDTDVIDPLVYNTTITRCASSLFVEAVVNPTIFSNRATGGEKPLRILDTPGTRAWNNDLRGGTWGAEIRQDERRNTHAPSIQLGSTWITARTELVNNDFGPDYTLFQLDTMDDGPKEAKDGKPAYYPSRRAEDMVSRVEGNRMPKGTRGTQIGWNDTQRQRKSLTIAQLEAQYPGIARGNSTPNPVGLPADLAAIAGVPVGTAQVGPLMPAPVAA